MDVPRWRHRNRAGQVPAQPSAASRTYSTIAVPTVLTLLRSDNVNNNIITIYKINFVATNRALYYFY